MKKVWMASVFCAALVLPSVAWSAGQKYDSASDLPGAIPADLPFPEEGDFSVKPGQTAAGKRYVITVKFSGDADAVFKDFKDYASNNGYEISTEGDLSFGSTNPSAKKGLTVRFVAARPSFNILSVTYSAR